VTINNNTGLYESCNWNEYNLNLLTRNNWRASLVPAAAVIPAPIAYIKVVAVKKLVVEFWAWLDGLAAKWVLSGRVFPSGELLCYSFSVIGIQDFYFEKIRVFKAGLRLNTLAWNNRIGLWFYFVGF
jgi:hypothetical protein